MKRYIYRWFILKGTAEDISGMFTLLSEGWSFVDKHPFYNSILLRKKEEKQGG